jgi:hypothetical protein
VKSTSSTSDDPPADVDGDLGGTDRLTVCRLMSSQ